MTRTRTYHIPGATFQIDLELELEPFDALADFALRRNPKRRFLFVSKVLGRHVPTRPADLRRVAARLAADLPTTEPAVVVGMAETATTLGQAVFRAWRERGGEGLYIDGTRRRTGGEIACSFSEDHSHATQHALHLPTAADDPQDFFRTAGNLIIVDDEATTGRTAAHLIAAFAQWRNHPASVFHTTLAVLLHWQQKEVEQVYFDQTTALARGQFTFTAESELSSLPAAMDQESEPVLAAAGSRHGLRNPQISPWRVPAGMAGKQVLVIGNGEFGFPPLCFAEELEKHGATAWLQATTRSPILCGGAIQHARSFPALTGEGYVEYLYNVPEDHPHDHIFLCVEESAPPADHPLLSLPKLQLFCQYDS